MQEQTQNKHNKGLRHNLLICKEYMLYILHSNAHIWEPGLSWKKLMDQ